eukprot:5478285-Lingulodinium_polyedra.AAC.1
MEHPTRNCLHGASNCQHGASCIHGDAHMELCTWNFTTYGALHTERRRGLLQHGTSCVELHT